MRFSFDPAKSNQCRLNPDRGIGFEEAKELFNIPYYLDTRGEDPTQFRAIGFVGDRFFTVIFEARKDNDGEYLHLVTLWRATRQEKTLYEKNIG